MNNKQVPASQEVDADLVRDLTAEEVSDVAGGPQVINDGPYGLTPGEVASVAGGPQVINDQPVN